MRNDASLVLLLILLGAGWGITQPFAKIAVSAGYQPLGLIFWQMTISAAVLAVFSLLRGKGLPLGAAQIRLYVIIALVGTVLPNSATYQALVYLPSGIISILLSLVPMFAFPVALILGVDRFGWLRLLGLVVGLCGVLLIVGPEASLPTRAMVVFIPLALIAPMFYGCEGNLVAKWGTAGCDAVQVLWGASLIGAMLVLPMAVMSGQWIDPRMSYGAPELALIASSCIHAVVYTGYVWLVGRAGSVFAAQVSYLVTGFGVMWAIVLLGESYSGYVWSAMAVMFVGLFLVQPRSKTDLAEDARLRKNASKVEP